MTTMIATIRDPAWLSPLGADAVLRAQGADPVRVRARSPRLVQLAERAQREGMSLLAPTVIQRRFTVLDRTHDSLRLREGGRLSSRLLATACAGAVELIVMAVTIGEALERASAEAAAREPGLALALDGFGTAAVEALAAAEARRIAAASRSTGSDAGPSLSPGMAGWPLETGQRQLFRLLGACTYPISLGAFGMMTPRKSLTLVIGLGPTLRADAGPCDFCTSRNHCRHRARPSG